MRPQLLLTCEHAGNQVPVAYAGLFRGTARILASHRGWDPGSWEMGQLFRRRLNAPLLYTKTTRLLVEVNRSVSHPRLFSEFTSGVDPATRREILARYYHPHRDRVESWIAERVATGKRVVHLSLHTFTPSLDGEVRDADVGLLYDPRRPAEKSLCADWRRAIRAAGLDLRVRRNYPYRGDADGLTTHLRRRFDNARYLGIELEVNQRFAGNLAGWRKLSTQLAESFIEATTMLGAGR